MQNALAVETEGAKVLTRYGRTQLGQRLLLARRLIEAGVTYVVVEDPGWAMSSGLEQQMTRKGPQLDQALTALADDLSNRGLFSSVLLAVWGEFGRSARLNKFQGRANSGSVFSVLLGGGGVRGGTVVGSSDANGQSVNDSPLRTENILATIYQVLGINPDRQINGPGGQLVPLLPQGKPIKQLI